MLRQISKATLLTAAIVVGFGCDAEAGDGELASAEVEPYVDGVVERTSQGAFEVTLYAEHGEVISGANRVYVRVAMHDPNPGAVEGWGIPNADLDVAVECEDQPRAPSDARISYRGDGTYELAKLHLAEGACAVHLDIAVGETVTDDVSFYFLVE